MSDNPLANILARLVGERSDVASRAFERAAFDYAMTRGCDLGRDGEAYARLRVVTSAVRGGDYNEAWMRGALDALRDAIYSSRSRAEELRRRVDEALRAPTPDALFGLTYDTAEVLVEGRRVDATEYLASRSPRESEESNACAPTIIDDPRSDEAPSPDIVARTMEYATGIGLRFSASAEDNDDVVQIIANGRDAGYATSRGIRIPVSEVLTINNVADLNAAFGEGSEIANAFRYARERTNPAFATGDDLDRLAITFGERRIPGEPDARLRERIMNPMRFLRVARKTDTATQIREALNREMWCFRILNGLIPSRMRPCVSCGVESIGILCVSCDHHRDPAMVIARWRERLAARQRHAAPVPLDVLGGVCASRLYPEAPRADDTVRLRCPLRRSPDRGVTLCVAQPTTDCVTPTRREA